MKRSKSVRGVEWMEKGETHYKIASKSPVMPSSPSAGVAPVGRPFSLDAI
jgi:hypothetical protein